MAGIRLAAPLQALRGGYSEAAVGFLVALFALTQVFFALPAGRFADRAGVRRPIALGVGFAVFGAAMAVAWPVFPVLCLAALLTGGATGCASIAMQRHVGRVAHSPTELRRVFSWMAIGPAIANFMGPFLAGTLIDLSGFRGAFALMALLPLATLLCLRQVHDLPALVPQPVRKGQKAWDLAYEPSFRRLLVVNWLIASCWDVHTFIVPVLGHERGLSASVIGSILGAFAIAAAVVRLVLPVVASRVREWALIAGVMIVTALVFAAYPLMPGPVTMGLCSVLLGLALGSVQPMVMSMLHQITPEHRHGEAVALRVIVINASSVAMPMLFGAAGAVVGVKGVFWLMGSCVGAGSRLAFRLRGAIRDGRTS
ncbi:MAG: MFS transporter [Burkholderiales bacterium]|nr:MFS transporter [Burkholderiales bacterium]